MIRRVLIFTLLFALVYTSTAFAQSLLTLSPNPLDENINSNQEYIFPIKLTNNHNFTIFNISFSSTDFVTYPKISSLAPNTSVDSSITVNVPTESIVNLQSTVSYVYFGNFSQEPKTFDINIYQYGIFNPNSVVAMIGDTIRFFNKDSLNHYISSPYFDVQVPINGNYTYTFTETNEFFIVDDDWQTQCSVSVISNLGEEAIHNAEFDQIFYVNLNSQYSETSLFVEFVGESNFNIENHQSDEGLLRITNTGDQLAHSIHLSSNKWIDFNQNNFNINTGDSKYIIFTITPDISNITETDQNYTLPINIKGINTQEVIKNVDLFVPHDESLEDYPLSGLSYDELRELLLWALGQLDYYNQTYLNGSNQTIYANFTAEQIQNAITSKVETKDQLTDINDLLQKYAGDQELMREQITSLLLQGNQTNELSLETKRDSDNAIIIFASVLTLLVGAFVFFNMKKHFDDKRKKDFQKEKSVSRSIEFK